LRHFTCPHFCEALFGGIDNQRFQDIDDHFLNVEIESKNILRVALGIEAECGAALPM
jgi:hypothetical protein